jgi:hypothetical protein
MSCILDTHSVIAAKPNNFKNMNYQVIGNIRYGSGFEVIGIFEFLAL